MSLPLLPVNDIELAFQDVRATVGADTPSLQQLLQLLRYVEKQWLKKATIGAARLSVRDNTARTNNAMESFHAALRRRVKVAHPNLFTFLGHLCRTTTDHQNDMARVNRGLAIRRAKKKVNLINDARIKTCISRYDNGAYTRIQFLRAASYSVGAHSALVHETDCDSDDDDDDTTDAGEEVVEAQRADDPQQNDVCEVCLVAPRDTRLALVPCGHQRFCRSCVEQLEQQQLRCPLCRTDIQMVLRLFQLYD